MSIARRSRFWDKRDDVNDSCMYYHISFSILIYAYTHQHRQTPVPNRNPI